MPKLEILALTVEYYIDKNGQCKSMCSIYAFVFHSKHSVPLSYEIEAVNDIATDVEEVFNLPFLMKDKTSI